LIILDTDIISVLDTRSGGAYDNLARRLGDAQVERVCVTIVSVEEQMRGWLSYIAASRTTSRQVEGYSRLHRMIRWYEQQEVIDFDPSAAGVFDELKRARLRMGAMDLKIAAIALDRGALLLSRNLRDFKRVPHLLVEDWTRPIP
jgi:tRNA(fMet)-specific endonuclease VapC